jgi:hypothetical protein
MSKHGPVFEAALGAVWTAGYRPESSEKHALLRACGWFDVRKAYEHGPGFDGLRDYIRSEALRALTDCGYALAAEPQGFDLVQPVNRAPAHAVPQPGDIVRAAVPWMGCSEFGLQGVVGEDRRGFTIATRNGGWSTSTKPDRAPCYSMGCGGPASIGYLDTEKLRATDQIDRLKVWDFAFTPEAHTGVYFFVPVRVWEWSSDDGDFLGWEEAEQPFYRPELLTIERKRRSTTQGEVLLTYDGQRIEQFGDEIKLRGGGEFDGKPDEEWHQAAREWLHNGRKTFEQLFKERCAAAAAERAAATA